MLAKAILRYRPRGKRLNRFGLKKNPSLNLKFGKCLNINIDIKINIKFIWPKRFLIIARRNTISELNPIKPQLKIQMPWLVWEVLLFEDVFSEWWPWDILAPRETSNLHCTEYQNIGAYSLHI